MTHDAETVERVAKALSHSAGLELECLLPQTQGKYRRLARAALSALPPKEVSVQEAAKVLMPYIENVVKSIEPHFVSYEDIEDTIYGMKIRMIVALRALSEGKV